MPDSYPASDIHAAFEAAVTASTELTQRPDNATLLKMYALYKQATVGDNSEARPGLSDLVGRAKWDAWTALKGLDAPQAMQRYVELIDSLE